MDKECVISKKFVLIIQLIISIFAAGYNCYDFIGRGSV